MFHGNRASGSKCEITAPSGNLFQLLDNDGFSFATWLYLRDDADLYNNNYIFSTLYNPFNIEVKGIAKYIQFTWRDADGNTQSGVNSHSNVAITGGAWFHVGIAVDDNAEWVKFYLNGSLLTSGNQGEKIDRDTSRYTTDPRLGNYGVGAGNNGTRGSMADSRLYNTILTDANFATLADINPATNVSGSVYPDPDNDLGAFGWWKLGATATGSLDVSNYGTSGTGFDGTINGDVKSGFVTVTGSAGYGAINNNYEHMTLTNTYVSGMADVVVGQYMDGTTPTANTSAKFTTKGTVVMD